MSDKKESTSERLNRSSYIFLNLTSSALSSEIERLCLDENLTEAHFRILWVLCRESSEEGRAMGEIADGLINRAADLTRLVDKLEKMGLVVRERSPDDRRRIVARATSPGRKTFARLSHKIRSLHVDQWDALTQAEQRQLIQLLDKVLTSRASSADESWLLRGGTK